MAAKTAKHKLLVIEVGVLTALAANPVAAKEFPFLKAVHASGARVGCGGCQARKQASARAAAYTAAKAAIAGLDSARKRRLKEILHADQLRVVYQKSNGKGETLTF